MAVLTNLSVPTTSNSAPGTIMPKMQYRFRVSFGFDTSEVVTSNVISVTRPTLSHDEVTLDTYNSRIYLAGKHTWEAVSIVIRDDVANSVITQIDNQMSKQIDMVNQASPQSGSSYKFQCNIETLDGGNTTATVLDKWELYGCYIQNVAYGESNYATSEAQQITVTLRYDNAQHLGGDKGPDLFVGGSTAGGTDQATANGQ